MPVGSASRGARPASSAPSRPAVERKTDSKKHNSMPKDTSDQNGKKKKKKKPANDLFVIPKTAQETVPIYQSFANGVIEVSPGFYTKTYKLADVNFRVAPQEDQEEIFANYEGFINSFDSNTKIQITINNRNVDEETLEKELMNQLTGDSLDVLRNDQNEIISLRLSEGKNNLVSDKFLTVGMVADSVKQASNAFATRVDKEVDAQMKTMLGRQTSKTPPLTIEERIKCLHDIYNIGSETALPEQFNIKDYLAQGLGVKDLIAPPAIKFFEDHFKSGDVYGQVLYIKTLPTIFSTDFIAEISDMPFNLTASVHLEPIEQKTAVDLVRRQMVVINGNVVEAQKRAAREGYGADLISPELMASQEQARYLMDDIRQKNQRLFFATIVIAHYAETEEQLKENSKAIISMGNRYMCGISKLNYQQEIGLATALPICNNKLFVKRLLKTESAALFIPFNSQEILEKNGLFYGVNALSRNLLMLDRTAGKNPNACVLGLPGAGKSVVAKLEIMSILLSKGPDNQIFVIDPEGEYVKMANAIQELVGDAENIASVVHIQPGSGVYINPLDMDMGYGNSEESSESPLVMKSDFITSFFAVATNGQISSTQKNIIDRVVRLVYQDYMVHMESVMKDSDKTIDTSVSPTLDLLYLKLQEQPEEEAHELAVSIEMYAQGNFDCFARFTNVDTNSRFVVYDIKDIGSNVKELGLQVCLDNVWNKTISNSKAKIRTWIYLDEFHIIAKSKSASDYVMQIWKRARKWRGVPCAITQNLEDMLITESSRAILNNCEFVIMLAQSPIDREGLRNLYKISSAQLQYITNSPSGQGLIYNGQTIIPFDNKMPEDSKIFALVTTKPKENTDDEDDKSVKAAG